MTGGGLASCTNLLQLVSVRAALEITKGFPDQIAQIATGSGSIVDGVQTYVQGLCTQAPCSTDTITTARNTIQQGCASDIQSGSELPVALNAILGNYNDTRALLCSQNSSNGTYCVPTTLRAVEQASGQRLSISSVTGLVSGDGLGDLLQNTPNSAVCTDVRSPLVPVWVLFCSRRTQCGKAIVSLGSRIVANVSQSGQSSVESAAGQKCVWASTLSFCLGPDFAQVRRQLW